jgi:hypothetical protein
MRFYTVFNILIWSEPSRNASFELHVWSYGMHKIYIEEYLCLKFTYF